MDRTNVIGEKVKSLRTAKEISLEELADRTGLAVEQITRIEENIDIPSLAPLVKLARALGVRLGTFLDDQPDEAGPVVCRRGNADDTITSALTLSFTVAQQDRPTHGTVYRRHRRKRK